MRNAYIIGHAEIIGHTHPQLEMYVYCGSKGRGTGEEIET